MAGEIKHSMELSKGEAFIAITFLIIILGVIYAILSGAISNPIIIGLSILYAVLVVMFGISLLRIGRVSMYGLVLYLFLVIGITTVVFGLVKKGALPTMGFSSLSIYEDTISTTLLYSSLILAIAVIVIFLYVTKRTKIFK
ncbi:MAG: hypothetical protein QXJ72_06890 [Thermoproteota archaeon]